MKEILNPNIIIDPLTGVSDDLVMLGVSDFKEMLYKEQLITRTKGFENLILTIPLENKKQEYFKQERQVKWNDKIFTIKKVVRDKQLSKLVKVECDALWYELGGFVPLLEDRWYTGTTVQVATMMLANTGWRVGNFEVTKNHNFIGRSGSSPLYLLRYLAKLVEGELWFDTQNKTVNYAAMRGERTEKVVDYSRNLQGITRTDDTTAHTTRIYMYGADGLTIENINDGRPYLEDYSWYDEQGIPRKIISEIITDERFALQESMIEYMQDRLNTYSRPVVTYEVDRYILDGAMEIGDTLYISDYDLDKFGQHRVIEVEVDIIQQFNSVYVLDFALDDLSSDDSDADEYVADVTTDDIVNIDQTLQQHIADQARHITNSERISWSTASNTINDHVNNTTIHVTAANKTLWNGYNALITALTTRLDTAESNIADLQARVSALEGGI